MQIKINMKLMNWNETINKSRSNRIYANRLKQKEMEQIRYFMLGTPKITKYPIKMWFEWHIKNINQDLDNKSVKSILDEMQQMGILENDNCKHINEIRHTIVKDKEDFVIMNIEEG